MQIQKMYNELRTGGRVIRSEKQTDKSLSGSYVRHIHMVLHAALKQAMKERLIPYNPCDNCRIPSKEKKEMTIIPTEKLGAYLREAEKYGVLPIFFLELSSGLRRGELLGLKWQDIDWKNGIIKVRRQVARVDGEIVEAPLKTKNSYLAVSISPQAIEVLRERKPMTSMCFPLLMVAPSRRIA